MIDIHNHIIDQVDDGSQSIEQSIQMIKAASNSGVTTICATPHYMEDGYRTDKEILKEKLARLQECLREERIPVELLLGEEIFIFPDLPRKLDEIVSMNHSRYLLIELPMREEINFADDVFYELFTMGKIPILAHPERYYTSAKDFSFLEKLAEKGVLFQVNVNSLQGYYGKEAKRLATTLLKNNMVHFLASDAHSSSQYELVKSSMAIVQKLVGEEKAKELLEDNPGKVLRDEVLLSSEVEYTVSNENRSRIVEWIKKVMGKHAKENN